MSNEPQPLRITIAIIGAGIAGPVFALQILSHPLLKQRYRAIIYEKRPDPAPPPSVSSSDANENASGAAVALTSNALFPLYSLGLKQALDAISCETEKIKIWRAYSSPSRSSKDENAGKFKYLNQVHSPNWQEDLGTCLRVVERGALQSLLLVKVRELGGQVVWGAKVRDFEKAEGGVRLCFEGGESREEVVVGLVVDADGGWSDVRRHLITSSSQEGRRKVNQDERWKPDFVNADTIYGVSRRIETDAGGGGVGGQGEGETHWVFLDSGMASSWALPEGKQFWTISFLSKNNRALPERNQKGGDETLYGASVSLAGYELEDTKRALEKYETEWHPVAGTFGNLMRHSERIVRTPLWYRVWEADEIGGEHMVVIGDAARLMLPNSGQGNSSYSQNLFSSLPTFLYLLPNDWKYILGLCTLMRSGACFAIEDATVLANALLNNPPSSQNGALDFSKALEEYVKARVPRSKSMTKQSYWTAVVMGWMDSWWLRWIVDLSTTLLPTGGDPKL
jgi:2-polyprenyl-6-methoxyphenol hydroxylase-like FAD-dependent oxidoreductase